MPTIRLKSWLIAKSEMPPPQIQIGDEPSFEVQLPLFDDVSPVESATPSADARATEMGADSVSIPLNRIAHARSGDKGNDSNIAILARREDYFPLLREFLSPELVARHFAEDITGTVERFEAPGLHGLNFLLHDALGGGGMSSMRIDPQGKALGQRLLEMELPVPRDVADKLGLATAVTA